MSEKHTEYIPLGAVLQSVVAIKSMVYLQKQISVIIKTSICEFIVG